MYLCFLCHLCSNDFKFYLCGQIQTSSMVYESHLLSNGIRLVHKFDSSPVAYCGLAINTGTRDEADNEQGMAHFIEHMLFKGTKKRKAWHILNCLENVGGELNAYTGKEETFVYAAVLTEDFERAMELTADIVFNATFPKNEIEREVDIILDEIQSYKDTPSEQIYDDFEELVFADSPIGRNILGKAKQLKNYKKADADRFIKNNYHTDEMVFFSLGNINFKKIMRWAEKYLACYPASLRSSKRVSPSIYIPQQITNKKDTHQLHLMLGNRAYSLHDENRLGMYMLNNIVGGPGMNSMLNLTLRERSGLVYSVESSYTAFTDTGIISIYLGSDQKNKDRCLRLVNKELKKLREEKISAVSFARYKKQLIGQVTIASQNKESLALSIGKSFMHFNRIESIEETKKKLDELTPEKLMNIANEVFDEKSLSSLTYL